jgi:F-type H+-transporting ATPase subunit epsilon
MSELKLEIISPTGVLFKGECHMAVVPSVAGEIGIMYGHEAVVAKLQEGKVSIYDEKNNLVRSFDITSGFAEMHGAEKLLVLVD